MKTITIDGQEFELVQLAIETNRQLGKNTTPYGLRPLKPVSKEEKEDWIVQFFRNAVASEPYLLNESLDITKSQAQTIAEAIKALLEYIESQVDGGKTTTEKHNAFINMSREAGKAHKLLGKPERKK